MRSEHSITGPRETHDYRDYASFHPPAVRTALLNQATPLGPNARGARPGIPVTVAPRSQRERARPGARQVDSVGTLTATATVGLRATPTARSRVRVARANTMP